MKTRFTSIALAFALLCTLTVPAFASDEGRLGQVNKFSAGTLYSGYVDGDGSLWMWGYNYHGSLGIGSSVNRYFVNTPVKVLDNVVSVSCGDGGDDIYPFTAAVKTDGSLWMWGDGAYGQLGTGGSGHGYMETTPVKVMDNVVAVDCGAVCTAAIKTDGSLWMWGGLFSDEGEIVVQDTPVKVMDDVAAVSCGGYYTAAIKTDGSLWTMWSIDVSSEGTVIGFQNTPVKVMDGAASVSCGLGHIAVIKTDGSLWTWGWNVCGQIGTGIETEYQSDPIKIMDGAASVSCGNLGTAVAKTDGSLWAWGNNQVGQVGNGEYGGEGWFGLCQYTPVKVMDNVSAVSCSYSHTVAIKTDGTVWTWGGNMGGAGYDPNTMTILSSPAQVTVGTQAPATPPAVNFTDVPDWCAAAANWAAEKGIAQGVGNNKFDPNSTCKNTEILTFLWRAAGEQKAASPSPFTVASWYQDAVDWAYEVGLIDDTCEPNAPCTRADAMSYIWQVLGSELPNTPDSGFPDVPINADYAAAVAWAFENGVTDGMGGGLFGPDTTCTRGQIVTFLHRAYVPEVRLTVNA